VVKHAKKRIIKELSNQKRMANKEEKGDGGHFCMEAK